MKFILPYHLGSGNRGCEGICRGIENIFGIKREDYILYNMSQREYLDDKLLGIDKIGDLRFRGDTFFEAKRFLCKVINRLGYDKPYRNLLANFYLKDAQKGDYVLMTGGDIYCYEGGHILPNVIVKKAKEKGLHTVLYCASLEDRLLTPEVLDGIKCYDLIITRETLSSEILIKKRIENVVCPDPAFSLNPEPVELPDVFSKGSVVGINFSPFTDSSPLFHENMINLIEYIIAQGMKVCLIPHVFWDGQDDRESMKRYKEEFGERIVLLDATKYNYLQLRYIISKCEYFIGGRTHSVISAYSTKVPCIALGYSVKAKGIAKDICMPEYTVVDSKDLQTKNDLLNTFKRLLSERTIILDRYKKMDEKKKKSKMSRSMVLALEK